MHFLFKFVVMVCTLCWLLRYFTYSCEGFVWLVFTFARNRLVGYEFAKINFLDLRTICLAIFITFVVISYSGLRNCIHCARYVAEAVSSRRTWHECTGRRQALVGRWTYGPLCKCRTCDQYSITSLESCRRLWSWHVSVKSSKLLVSGVLRMSDQLFAETTTLYPLRYYRYVVLYDIITGMSSSTILLLVYVVEWLLLCTF